MLLANPQRRFVNLFNRYDLQSVTAIRTLTPTPLTLMTTTAFNVIVDSFVMVQAIIRVTKGATPGNTEFRLFQSTGVGRLRYMNELILSGSLMCPRAQYLNHPGTGTWAWDRFWLLRASLSGDVQLTLEGWSAGSNSTIEADQGHMEIFLFL